jgi:hypothetical protein
MKTAQDRFYKSDSTFLGADGKRRPCKVYSYESRNTLYDVLVFTEENNFRCVRVNCEQLSNMISDWRPHHYAIENHFGLG